MRESSHTCAHILLISNHPCIYHTNFDKLTLNGNGGDGDGGGVDGGSNGDSYNDYDDGDDSDMLTSHHCHCHCRCVYAILQCHSFHCDDIMLTSFVLTRLPFSIYHLHYFYAYQHQHQHTQYFT